jgi:diguanylate cyclase (GGDEF)-like protein
MTYNIVLINDNKNELKNLVNFLSEAHDINLTVIGERKSFEEYIKDNHIHLILANERCVELDPLALCQHIRSLSELNFLPFLYLSADKDLKHIQNAYEIGVNEYIKSPFNLDELLLKIHRYIINYEALKKCLGQNERLAIVVATDQLTKVSNRMHLQTLLTQAMREYDRYDNLFSIIYFRINDMQKINAIFGFLKGDKLLRDVAQYIAKEIRVSDVIARWGGSDFIILTPNTSLDAAKILAEKLDKKFRKKNFLNSFTTHINYGITQVVKGDDIYSITDRAKKALQISIQNHSVNIVTI